jgi:hypothetical protein
MVGVQVTVEVGGRNRVDVGVLVSVGVRVIASVGVAGVSDGSIVVIGVSVGRIGLEGALCRAIAPAQ